MSALAVVGEVQVSFLFLTRTPAASGLTTEGGYPLYK